MRKFLVIAVSAGFFFLGFPKASAHGGDQPGPHGGKIMMPGAFHTEVIPEKGKDRAFLVYLLDMEFQNPSIKDSQVRAWIRGQKAKALISCKAEIDHFRCLSKEDLPDSGKLVLQAQRENAKGNEVSYDLPLSSH